jgi:hypothetical protein
MVNDLPVGRNPEEVLRLVQAFQFTGQLCLVHSVLSTAAVHSSLFLFVMMIIMHFS